MRKSAPWKVNRPPTNQKIPFILGNQNVHFHYFPPKPINLHRMNSAHSLSSKYFKIHFNINLVSTTSSSLCLFPSGFPSKTKYAFLFFPMRATYCVNNTLFIW